FVDDLEHEARLDARPADAFDQCRLRGERGAIARAPAVHEAAARGIGHAKPRVQAAIAQVAADGRGGAAGAGAAYDPGGFRIGFAAHLLQDGFGDVVVAAPVSGAFGQPELVEVAGAVCRVPRGACVHVGRVVDEVAH